MAQLADRLRPVDGEWPDGVELYLAATDLATTAIVDEIATRITSAQVPNDFSWLIEGGISPEAAARSGERCAEVGEHDPAVAPRPAAADHCRKRRREDRMDRLLRRGA